MTTWLRPLGLALAVALVACVYGAAFSAETPVGALKGRLLAGDTGRPLAGIRVVLRPAKPTSGEDRHVQRTKPDGTFLFENLPVGAYEVEPQTSAYEAKAHAAQVQEATVTPLDLRLKPGDPYLNVEVHNRAYLPEDHPRVALHGFRQGDSLRMRLIAVDHVALLRDYGGDIRSLLTPLSTDKLPEYLQVLLRHRARTVRAWTDPIRKKDAEGVFYQYERFDPLKPGLYLVSAKGAQRESLGWFLVTELALITKTDNARVVAYSTHLKTGIPLPGARVTLFADSHPVAGGTTDARGVAELRVGQKSERTQFSAVATRGTSLAYSTLNGANNGGRQERYRAGIYTDRPVYRPGQRVRYKGVLRHVEAIGYSVPSPRPVEIRVTDDQDTLIEAATRETNARGSFAGDFTLPAAASSGGYTIEATIEGEKHTGDFAVASYRKPEWRVDVKTPQPHYIRGDRVPVTIHAEYYYGAPVVNAKVHYTVYHSPYWGGFEGEDQDEDTPTEDDETPPGAYGEPVAETNVQTGADGTAEFAFSTALGKNDVQDSEYQYTIQAEVTDLTGRAVTGSGRVRVSPGELTIDSRLARFVAQPDETVPCRIQVRDFQDHPAARVSVTAETLLDVWTSGKLEERTLDSRTLRTDEHGRAEYSARVAQPGLAVCRFTVKDARGNVIRSTQDLWVSTVEGADDLPKLPRLSVIPDRKQYRIGQVAQILINTDRPGATAMVGVEADRIYELRMVPLKRKSTVVRFPIRNGYEPDVFVSACFAANREFITNHARLNVNSVSHRLQVSVEADREVYHPRDTALFRVRTMDAAGKPVPAEVSFGVVDESIYAIREEPKHALWNTFYPRRYNQVTTEFSYPQVYYGDADKDGSHVEIRKEFPDTAYWDPFVTTGPDGRATVRVRLPDSLTSWRATATAVTSQTGIGRATHNVRVMKELTLRLQTPRTVTEGDRLTITAALHNYSPGPLDASVSLNTQGLQLRDTGPQRVHLAPGAADTVRWDVTAPTPGKATVTATAVAGSYSDGMQLEVPVNAFAREEVVYRTGAVTTEAATEKLALDPQARSGDLEVRLAPSLAGTILGSLGYLAEYPYGCTEQTMSAFLPDVEILHTLESLGIKNSSLAEKLPKMTTAGLLRLYHYQHSNGGWGWWETDQTDPWMTSYVLFGLAEAKGAGISVNERIYREGMSAAEELAKKKDLHANDAMFLAYVLARAKKTDLARPLFAKLNAAKAKMQVRSLGYAVLALAATGESDDRRAAEALLEYVWSRAVSRDSLSHWEENVSGLGYYEHPPEDVESTAVVLKAALAVTPDDPRLAGIVRWLLLRRRGDHWESTRDSAWILFALTDYLKTTGELKPNYHLAVTLNGRTVDERDVTPGDALQPESVLRVPLKELTPANSVEVRKTGEGTLYYALQLTQQIHAESFGAKSSVPGFTIERGYYPLETKTGAKGAPVVTPSRNPITRMRAGDRLMVRLRVHCDHPMQYVLIEDPLPAGFEVQDRGQVRPEEWDYWWSHVDVRDDRVALFARDVPKGDHVLEYYVRPETEGTLRLLPAIASDMYVPSTRASTADSRLEVAK